MIPFCVKKSNSPGDPMTGRRRTVSPLGICMAQESRFRVSSSVFHWQSLWQTLPVVPIETAADSDRST